MKSNIIHKKHSLLCLCFFIIRIAHAQLTINITSIPLATPSNTDIYIAANINNWNPGDASYILTDNGDDTYSITISPNPGLLEYKFTQGSWETVEGTAAGDYIPNRTYNYTGGVKSIDVTIAGWEGKGGTHTASENVHIINEAFYMP